MQQEEKGNPTHAFTLPSSQLKADILQDQVT